MQPMPNRQVPRPSDPAVKLTLNRVLAFRPSVWPRPLALLWLARPHFLAGAAACYLLGAAYSLRTTGTLNWPVLILGLAVMWLVQLATHLVNEYYDRPTDSMNPNRTLFTGGSGVLSDGTLPPWVALWGTIAAFILAVLVFLLLAVRPGFSPIAALIFALAIIGGVGYSLPPLQFANRGLGEFDAGILVGLLAPLLSYELQAGRLDAGLVPLCLPLVLLISAAMIDVGLPDYEADRATGKRTLVVKLGRHGAARLVALLVLAGYILPWLLVIPALPGYGPELIPRLDPQLAVPLAIAATLPLGLVHLAILRLGGYRRPDLFGLNAMLGIATLISVNLAEIIAVLAAR